MIRFLQGGHQIERRFDRHPFRAAVFAMALDAQPHFIVGDLPGGDIDQAALVAPGKPFRMTTLAGARPAEDKRDPFHDLTGGKRAMKWPRIACGQALNGTSPLSLAPWRSNQARIASAFSRAGAKPPAR